MPRQSRIDAPAAIHHVILRGIERRNLFKDHEDYNNFLARLADLITSTDTRCYAFALMSNHVHLLLRTGAAPLSTLMRRLLTGYAVWFNHRHRRHGHLFQNRYRSFLCEEDPYLLELVRYIHLNPLRAGMVKDIAALSRFVLTGHATLMGVKQRTWQDTAYILRFFSANQRAARPAYRRFVEEGAHQGKRPDLVGGGLRRSHGRWAAVHELKHSARSMSDERILGSSAFVASVLRNAHEVREKNMIARVKGITLDELLRQVAGSTRVAAALICSSVKKRNAVRARALVCALAIDTLGVCGTRLAAYLGITSAAVSKLACRGRADTALKDLTQQIVTRDNT